MFHFILNQIQNVSILTKVCLYCKHYSSRAVFVWLHCCCDEWEGLYPLNRFNHTSWMPVVTPTDCLKSVRNRCAIEVFGGVFVLSIGFRIFSWYRDFCHRTESDLLLFLFTNISQFEPKCSIQLEYIIHHYYRLWIILDFQNYSSVTRLVTD